VGGGMVGREKGWATPGTATYRLHRHSNVVPWWFRWAPSHQTYRSHRSQSERTSKGPVPGRGIRDFISSPVEAGRSCQSEDHRSVSSFTQPHLHMCDCNVWIEFVLIPCNSGHMNV
jgi:hypothetical protein